MNNISELLLNVSTCEEQQQLDFVFEDNFGKRVEYTVMFASERTKE